MTSAFRMLSFGVALLLCFSICSITYALNPAQQAERSAMGLYETIKNVASPQMNENSDSRFILMMPGKVLNYHDYFPGKEYTEFVQNPDKSKRFAIVPPHVMENWFDLADVVPNAYPLNGQDTGKSLANIYREVLTGIKIKNLEEQGDNLRALYQSALDFLNKVVPHPEDLGTNTTRLALYDQYKELYNERRLEMEEEIELKRNNLQYLDYELWFQRHYPLLLSKVESAYVRWLIFGQKEICDVYITIVDTGSSAKALEEARVVLRSAGVSSLDRTRTIYPVDFEPSDWYKYLVPSPEEEWKPSKTELQQMLGRINSKIETIEKIIFFYKFTNVTTYDDYAKRLENTRNNHTSGRITILNQYLKADLECSVHNKGIATQITNFKDPCGRMTGLSKILTKKLADEADSIANVGEYSWTPENRAAYIKSLEAEKEELKNKKNQIFGALGQVDPLIGSILNADPVVIAGIIDAKKEDNWLQFEYTSSENKSSSSYRSSYSRYSQTTRSRGWWFSRSGSSYTHTSSSSSYESAMSKSSLKAKGKLLRVYIKRPWFKPEVFDDRNLEFIANTETGGKVLGSPGKKLNEEAFIKAITGDDSQDGVLYRLPEYVTSFLLAKDVELEFSNVANSAVRDTVSTYTHASSYASYFCFSASFSSTRSNYKSKSGVHKKSNGMVIKIPGAQVIGYYMQRLPKFPATP